MESQWQAFSDTVNTIGLVVAIGWLLYSIGLRRVAIGWTILLFLAPLGLLVLGILAASSTVGGLGQ